MFEDNIFSGKIRHRRFSSKPHRFSYQLFMFCFDIKEPRQAFRNIKQVSIERWNWFSFRRKNYLNYPDISMDAYARQLVVEKFKTYPKGKIYLLTQLECLGYCFNPISLFFFLDEGNQKLDFLILEVTNTPWGEKHNYILKSSSDSKNETYHFNFQKELHVSPFLSMDYTYHLNLKLSTKKIIVHMENHIDGKKDFDATLMLKALTQMRSTYSKLFRQHSIITFKLVIAIYWQAFKLWLKGVPVHWHPNKDKRI
ncbi:MAG: DUF1365 domain-containing protein [Legionella sp.]|nr:DUF1365 domain-containing protein [Legionella sp.]